MFLIFKFCLTYYYYTYYCLKSSLILGLIDKILFQNDVLKGLKIKVYLKIYAIFGAKKLHKKYLNLFYL